MKPLRPIRIEGNVAYVPLTQGYEAIIDIEDAELVGSRNWCVANCGRNRYAVSKLPTECKPISMHRFLMNPDAGLFVDHINGNGIDNRRSNLRLATNAQNQWNQRRNSANTSGYKGVEFHKPYGKWRARITHEGDRIDLGYFKTKEEAAASYRGAAIALFKKYARVE